MASRRPRVVSTLSLGCCPPLGRVHPPNIQMGSPSWPPGRPGPGPVQALARLPGARPGPGWGQAGARLGES
eukprot:14718031-Heterocapsa_arctica.AAC.1